LARIAVQCVVGNAATPAIVAAFGSQEEQAQSENGARRAETPGSRRRPAAVAAPGGHATIAAGARRPHEHTFRGVIRMLSRRPSTRLFAFALAAALACAAVPARAQLAPLSYDRGATGLGLALRRLPVGARVLYVTAHPDDENNAVLAALSRGGGVRTALLTLTRGDGGQNALGPELFEALGVLRTEELSALHLYDGVEQYFTRAYEFGFSFSVDETLRTWGPEATLGAVVRVMRAFRPDVVLTLPLEAPGEHAHHLAAARLAREAFHAAADARRFPEQVRAGLRPWQAARLYQGGTGGGARDLPGPRAVVATGSYDALVGLSALELGSLERALHKSQGASQLKADPGPADFAYALVEGAAPPDGSDLFAGLDATLAGLRRLVPAGAPGAGDVAAGLAAAQAEAERAQGAFDVRAPERTLPALRAGLARLRAARALVASAEWDEDARAELERRLADKEDEFAEALRRAHGLVLEAAPSDDLVVPGQTFDVTVRAWNQGGAALDVEDVSLDVPPGWGAARVADAKGASPERGTLDAGGAWSAVFRVSVAPDARPSQPYWSRAEGAGRYALDLPADESLPWSPPPVIAVLRYRSDDTRAAARAAALSRYEGRALSREKQKELQVVPALSVRLTPQVAVVPTVTPGARREFRVTVVHYAAGAADVRVRLAAPPGFGVSPPEQELRFTLEGEEQSARFTLRAPAALAPGRLELRAVATLDGREYASGDQVIAYDHVQERRLYRDARATLLALDVRVRTGVAVGYVPGVGDPVPEALRQLGVPVSVLSADDLAFGDLSRYSTLVTGVRAYTDAAVRSSQARLMAWVAAGGHLVVQYNRGEFNQAGSAGRAVMGPGARAEIQDSPFAPYPASVTAKRVSDETAPLTLLRPAHALFTAPNTIGPRDFEGWVQERAIQLLDARDPRYVELLAGADPFPENPGDKRGLLVEARVGKGTWTYVGLALFRQLASGVPGAYRLLANLVSR
jgi:LmbE family N-acetylglucosaminyl deacetylase